MRVAPPGRPAVLNASGYVTPRRRATIAAKITGRVNEIFAEEGMRVKVGEVLATLDDSDARARLLSATAERNATAATLADLRVNLANAERDRQAVGGALEGRRGQRAVRRPGADRRGEPARPHRAGRGAGAGRRGAGRRSRAQDLENTIIRAPFAGLVVSKDAQRGEMVSPISAGGGFTRTGIATIVDMTSLEIEVDVNESSLARVTPEPAGAGRAGRLPRLEDSRPRADDHPDGGPAEGHGEGPGGLRPPGSPHPAGHGGEGDVPRARAPGRREARAPQAVVPRAAIRQEGESQAVYLLRDGRVERRAVRLGQTRGADQDVTGELADGDQIVVKGLDGLQDGQTGPEERLNAWSVLTARTMAARA